MARVETQAVVMLDNAKVTAAAGLGDAEILGLFIPAIVSGTLTFSACATIDGTYQDVKGLTLTTMAVSTGTGDFFLGADALSPLRGAPYVIITSNVSQTAGPLTFTWVLKRFGR